MLFGIVWWINGLTIPSQQNFEAILRPATTPIAVPLPAESVLDTIVVSEGQIVRVGETLAVLDRPQQIASHDNIHREIFVARFARHCLRHGQNASFAESLASWIAKVSEDAELSERIAAVQQTCLSTQETGNAAVYAQRETVRLLNERLSVLNQALLQLTRPAKDQKGGAGGTLSDDTLKLLLARNDVQVAVSSAQRDLQALIAVQTDRRAEKLALLDGQIADLLVRQANAQTSRDLDRITAPVGGIVTRVRNPGLGHQGLTPMAIVDLSRSGSDTFRLELMPEQGGSGRLQVGLPVTVRLLGPNGPKDYEGTLVNRAAPDGEALGTGYDVALSPEDQKSLATGPTTQALAGAGTAALVKVVFGELTATSLLQREIEALWTQSLWARSISGPRASKGGETSLWQRVEPRGL